MKCIENEIPFEIPDKWTWTRLGNIFAHNTGKALNVSDTTGLELTYITTSNLYWDRFELGAHKKMYFTESELEKCTVTNGDLLVCEGGDIGRAAIWTYDENIRIQNHIHRLRAFIPLVNRFYYYVFYLWKLIDKIGGQGIGLQGFSSKALHNLIVPIPPLQEQHNIADKLDAIFTIVNDVEKAKEDVKEIIEQVKSRILDLAIRGKLVPQDPNDEPASVLLERIRAEKEELIKQGKIKRDKKESVIFKGEDNSYYETVPTNWEEVSLSAIAEIELGKTLDSVKNTGEMFPYLRSVNIQWNDTDLSDIKKMRFESDEIERYSVKKGDLLICEGGDVGRCSVWKKEGSIFYQNALHRVRFYGDCSAQFFVYTMLYLESIGYLKRISNGVTIKHLTKNILTNIPFLLPPIAEQHRIVCAVETYFSTLDKISNSLS